MAANQEPIDELRIAVSADTQSASRSITSLTKKLQKLQSVTNQMTNNPLPGTGNGSPSNSSGNSNVITGQSSKYESLIKTMSKLKTTTTDIEKKLYSAITKPFQKIGQFFTSLKRIAMYRLIRTIISSITKDVSAAMKSLYSFDKLKGLGEFSKSMDNLKTEFSYLGNVLATTLAPAIQLLEPLVLNIGDKFADFINQINQGISHLAGNSGWYKAIKVENAFTEATEAAAEGNKKLKQTFMGIDEITTLNAEKESETYYKSEFMPFDNEELEESLDLLDKIKKIGLALVVTFAAIKALKLGVSIASVFKGLGIGASASGVAGASAAASAVSTAGAAGVAGAAAGIKGSTIGAILSSAAPWLAGAAGVFGFEYLTEVTGWKDKILDFFYEANEAFMDPKNEKLYPQPKYKNEDSQDVYLDGEKISRRVKILENHHERFNGGAILGGVQ